MPFIGERLAEKVYEIASTGGLRRLDNVDKEREKVIEMFKNIHGVGMVTAQQFYAQVGTACMCKKILALSFIMQANACIMHHVEC